jgi:hypothetical protein
MLRIILIASVVAASPAHALDTRELGQGGSMLLPDLAKLVGESPRLTREINEALGENDKKAREVVCTGYRFSSQWIYLGGTRVAPYTCNFGRKWLVINATVRITSRGGRVYDSITLDAKKNAQYVIETKPVWRWTIEAPDATGK